ncbi:MAG: four helix bundle protein [Phaeodactylibacter sp.]|nr:four helix bundle protein [Phaeodactylibacter sp.]MCB9301460.1 four helix bundle protein [Lewinellaceae bacterium]HQU59739.1 four helix bundle protein [Saprospiraceae bacterium]
MEVYQFSFERLEAWKKALQLTKTVYGITQGFPSDEKFGLVTQMRRCAVGVPSHLAEGSARITNKDKAHYSTMSFSTLMELLNHLIISYELGYISKERYTNLRQTIYEVSRLLNGLRRSQISG